MASVGLENESASGVVETNDVAASRMGGWTDGEDFRVYRDVPWRLPPLPDGPPTARNAV